MQGADTQQLLSRIVQALNANDLATAEKLSAQAVRASPRNADALQLAGVTARKLGQLDRAIELLSAAAKASGRAEHWNSLGGAFLAAGRSLDAQGALTKAVALNPQYAQAHHNLGLALAEIDAPLAAQHFRRAAQLMPAWPEPQFQLGLLLWKQGNFADAEAALASAAALHGSTSAVLEQLTALRLETGKVAEAAQDLDARLARAPQSAPLWRTRAVVHVSQGDTPKAIAAFERAIALDPGNVTAHEGLAELKWQAKGDTESLISFKTAIDRGHGQAPLLRSYGLNLMRYLRFEEAIEVLQRAVRADPSSESYKALGQCLLMSADPGAAYEILQRCAPGDIEAKLWATDSLLAMGRFDDAAVAARAQMKLAPRSQQSIAQLATALRLSGDLEGYMALADPSKVVRSFAIDPPPGYRNTADFLDDLRADVRALHNMAHAPTYQSLRNGTQTQGNILARQSATIQALGAAFQTIIARYLDTLATAQDHPLLQARSGLVNFSASWSVCLRSGGFHVNHIHPKGWISSAFYIDLPKAVGEDGRKGWFKTGGSYLQLGEADNDNFFVKPEPGMLVLFPSFLWHGTVPFDGEGERLTVAFDAVPN